VRETEWARESTRLAFLGVRSGAPVSVCRSDVTDVRSRRSLASTWGAELRAAPSPPMWQRCRARSIVSRSRGGWVHLRRGGASESGASIVVARSPLHGGNPASRLTSKCSDTRFSLTHGARECETTSSFSETSRHATRTSGFYLRGIWITWSTRRKRSGTLCPVASCVLCRGRGRFAGIAAQQGQCLLPRAFPRFRETKDAVRNARDRRESEWNVLNYEMMAKRTRALSTTIRFTVVDSIWRFDLVRRTRWRHRVMNESLRSPPRDPLRVEGKTGNEETDRKMGDKRWFSIRQLCYSRDVSECFFCDRNRCVDRAARSFKRLAVLSVQVRSEIHFVTRWTRAEFFYRASREKLGIRCELRVAFFVESVSLAR